MGKSKKRDGGEAKETPPAKEFQGISASGVMPLRPPTPDELAKGVPLTVTAFVAQPKTRRDEHLRNKDLQRRLGFKIKQLRMEKNMTLEQLCYDSDLELSQLSRVELGKVNVGIASIDAIAKGLGVSLEELFRGL